MTDQATSVPLEPQTVISRRRPPSRTASAPSAPLGLAMTPTSPASEPTTTSWGPSFRSWTCWAARSGLRRG